MTDFLIKGRGRTDRQTALDPIHRASKAAGENIRTPPPSKAYEEGWERIFGKKGKAK